jgi:hypothetical protein
MCSLFIRGRVEYPFRILGSSTIRPTKFCSFVAFRQHSGGPTHLRGALLRGLPAFRLLKQIRGRIQATVDHVNAEILMGGRRTLSDAAAVVDG